MNIHERVAVLAVPVGPLGIAAPDGVGPVLDPATYAGVELDNARPAVALLPSAR